jgi:hypothetical protein
LFLDAFYGEFINSALAIQFPNLFQKAKFDSTLTLAQVFNNGNIHIPLTCGGGLELRREKAMLLDILTNFQF